jgi:hypothetical protein
MIRRWVLPALVVLAVAGIAVAVAYLESSNRADPPALGSSPPAPSTTLVPSTTVAPSATATTAAPPTTALPTTTAEPPTASTVATAITVASTPDVTSTTVGPVERSAVAVVVSSGPSSDARLTPGAELLAAVGWTDIRPLTGAVTLADTVVFHVDGSEEAARLLAVDAGLAPTSIAPMSEAPPVAGLSDAQLLFYFGAG